MKSASLLMKNTLILAATSIGLRFCTICFQAYLAAKIGAEQLGVFGIISSVGAVFATISISGVRFSVTRIAAEEISTGNEYPVSLMRCAFRYATFFGILAGTGLFFLAEIISVGYVGNGEAAVPLRMLALTMPAISLGGCIEGYFSAKQKVLRLVLVQIISQLFRIGFVVFLFSRLLERGVFPADILSVGSIVGEYVFMTGLFILYCFEMMRKPKRKTSGKYLPHLLKTAMPLAVSAYMRTGLSSLGQVIIPAGLKKSGMGTERAFASYGVIGQMAWPVIMFPAALLTALGEVLVPRLTDAQMKNQKAGISYIVNRALRIGAIFSFSVMGIMLFFADDIGLSVYKNAEAAFYIRILAPLVPVIYMDCVTDGCLKGLGQQVYSMVYNVAEGVINVVLLFLLLPKIALTGYIIVMYIKEIFNASLSVCRLSKITDVNFGISFLISAVGCMAGAWVLSRIVFPTGVLAGIIAYVVIYVLLMYIVNAVSRDDIRWAFMLVKYKKI